MLLCKSIEASRAIACVNSAFAESDLELTQGAKLEVGLAMIRGGMAHLDASAREQVASHLIARIVEMAARGVEASPPSLDTTDIDVSRLSEGSTNYDFVLQEAVGCHR